MTVELCVAKKTRWRLQLWGRFYNLITHIEDQRFAQLKNIVLDPAQHCKA